MLVELKVIRIGGPGLKSRKKAPNTVFHESNITSSTGAVLEGIGLGAVSIWVPSDVTNHELHDCMQSWTTQKPDPSLSPLWGFKILTPMTDNEENW
ncbi:hypothetical protein TSUD_87930 [Trifolium subterraneum]|uniref:Uncharacterized protein n=1 Tax=Trifolium subterraneum TaxID=3900 RepID=A0A2Z6P8D1_TRISU|nr:hypothetical protein TSUD_87930 [Trifolium subterraneum]